MKPSTENPIQVADRLFQTMELLATNPPMGLMDLSHSLELNKSTMHRILTSLIYLGYVTQETPSGKYTLTQRICDIASQFAKQTDVVSSVRPILEDLANHFRETVHLVQIEGDTAIYIDKIDSPKNLIPLSSKIGESIPLYCTGVGKALLADLSDDDIKDVWQNKSPEPQTANTITDYFDFMEEIERIRKNGYALDLEEYETGVRCIAISLDGYIKRSHYAISISAPVRRMDRDRIMELSEYMWKLKKQLQQETI